MTMLYSPHGDDVDRVLLRAATEIARGTCRPQVSSQPGLETGNGEQVWPASAMQDVADGDVIDAGLFLDGADAVVADRITQIHREFASGLYDRIAAGTVWPVRHQVSRVVTGRASHALTLFDADCIGVVSPLLFAGNDSSANRQQDAAYSHNGNRNDQIRYGERRSMDPYRPNSIPEDGWDRIADFVQEAVTDCVEFCAYSHRELMVAAAPHVWWSHQTCGLKLSRNLIFRRDVIADHIERGCRHLAPASAGNRRSQLLRMAEILLPNQPAIPMPALPAAEPQPPYSAAEITQLRSWARGQRTNYAQRNCEILLALGLGAGLLAADVRSLRVRHVLEDDNGVLLRVPGTKARSVPVLREWEDIFTSGMGSRDNRDGYLFRPRRTKFNSNLIGNFVDKTDISNVRPNLQRMRTTWIVKHLAAATPVQALVAAAGVQSVEAFGRYMTFVTGDDLLRHRIALREAQGPKLW